MLHHSPSHHASHHRYFEHKKIDAVYASLFIKLFAESFISVFTAIYLLSRGFVLSEVALFYVFYFTALTSAMFLARPLMKFIGVVKSIALGIIVLSIYYFLLRDVGDGVYYLIAASLYGGGAGLYFAGFHWYIQFSRV